MPAPSRTRASQHLLALTISTLAVFAVVIFAVLNALGRWHEQDFAKLPNAERNRYVNARLLAALKTFQAGIVQLPRAGARPAPTTAVQLLQGLPECRRTWDDAPGPWARKLAEIRQRKVDTDTTADRLAAKLAALDTYLARLSGGDNPRFRQPLVLDAASWFESARTALSTAMRTLVPEPCRQALLLPSDAVADTRVRQECRALENLDWRERSVASVLRNFAPQQQIGVPERIVAQRNPWGGVPGCVYWHTRGPGAGTLFYASDHGHGNRLVCENADVSGVAPGDGPVLPAVVETPNDAKAVEAMPLSDPRWSVPPSLDLLVRPLDSLRQPGGELYQDYTNRDAHDAAEPERSAYGRNVANIGGANLDVGFSVDLAIDATAQAYAQQFAACYTGSQAVCRRLGVLRSEDEGETRAGRRDPIGHNLQENAVVRMAGIAIIDIATGRIEAVAGAMSHCARQDDDGPGRGPECDSRLPWRPAYRRDLLENPALFHESMPASTIKPIMAAAFLTDGAYGARLLGQEQAADRPDRPPAAGLRYELMRSDSARFLDRMFCKEKGYADCERPWAVQRMALAMGWNTACAGRFDCGQRDVLFGRAPDQAGKNALLGPASSLNLFGRLLAEPIDKGKTGEDKRFHLMPERPLDAAKLRQCALGKDLKPLTKDDWDDCRAGYTSQVVHEGWGQSDARASAVGVASMMAMLGAAANGAASMPAPHLVEDVRGVGRSAAGNSGLLTAGQRLDLSPPLPVGIPAPVAKVILSGMNWSHRGGTASYACAQLWGKNACNAIDWIAGKTGTPSFHNDFKTLDAIARECRVGSCSSLRPYKWYAGVFRVGSEPAWNKAIAVLIERSWLKGNGPVYGAGDLGPNPAAEIGLQVARCLRENPSGRDRAACRE
jgi:hypothetical protein